MAQNNLSLEERTHLQDAATAFASYVTEKYPQINEEGQLNYYISGSLAVMLLSQVDSIDLLDSSQLPNVSTRETRSLGGGLSAKLADFTRSIGDFDYVETTAYKKAKANLPKHPDSEISITDKMKAYIDGKEIPKPVDYEEREKKYSDARKHFLWKGGGGPSIDELPDLAKDILAEAKSGYRIMCDPLSTYSEDQVARVKINDRDYFIVAPKQMFVYKVLHLMQSFDNKPDKFKKDFGILHDALSQLYSEDELIKAVHLEMLGYYGLEAVDDAYMRQLDQNPDFNSTVRHFFEKLKKYDIEHRNILQSNG